jgi:type II secretory pathway component GspD/PulD (secretin)
LLPFLNGCEEEKPDKLKREQKPDFTAFYELLEETTAENIPIEESKKITLSTSGMKLMDFLRFVVDQTGLSIICEQELDSLPVNVNVVDTDVKDVLSAVARRYGVDITEQGNVLFIGALQAQDRALLVRKVKRLTADEITSMVQTLNSEVGKVAASNDGLTVVGDRVRVLQNVSSMLDQVERAQTNTWLLQMYLISGTNSVSSELGFDTTASFDIAATLANSSSAITSLGVFNAVLASARGKSQYQVIAEPMMLITDGGASSIQDGETIPIPRRTVSDSGTVNTTGYDYIKTGLVVNTSLREMSTTSATCNLEIEMTQVSSYVDTAPVTTGQTFKTTAVLESGGTYLVGSLSRSSQTKDQSGAFVKTFTSREDDVSNVEIWLRCYRIRGGFKGGTS